MYIGYEGYRDMNGVLHHTIFSKRIGKFNCIWCQQQFNSSVFSGSVTPCLPDTVYKSSPIKTERGGHHTMSRKRVEWLDEEVLKMKPVEVGSGR